MPTQRRGCEKQRKAPRACRAANYRCAWAGDSSTREGTASRRHCVGSTRPVRRWRFCPPGVGRAGAQLRHPRLLSSQSLASRATRFERSRTTSSVFSSRSVPKERSGCARVSSFARLRSSRANLRFRSASARAAARRGLVAPRLLPGRVPDPRRGLGPARRRRDQRRSRAQRRDRLVERASSKRIPPAWPRSAGAPFGAQASA